VLQPGQEVDRFRVEAVLGKGGMAVVYKVQHKVLGSSYALKVLTAPTENQRARLVREGRVQSQLRHENIVSVHDVLEVEGAPALLMDFVDGPSLRDWIKANDPEPADAEALFRQVLAGVERAHEAGVVHRDLKPGDVLLELRRQGPLAHVADFGLVKASDDVFETRTGASMGTPAYMAPEQVRNAKEVDQRADIWALGCILYALVVGKPPFRGRDQLALFNNIANGAYEPAGERVPGLPARIDDAIRVCLTPDPDRRAPTCAAVRAVLDGRVAAEVEAPPVPEPAEPPGPAEPEDAPAPEPKAEPEPATVRISGDAVLVKRRDAAGRDWPPGAVPAGRYTVRARFGHEAAGALSEAGTAVLEAGKTLTLHCDRRFGSCGVR
jgi:serine/threonine-protein kinase